MMVQKICEVLTDIVAQTYHYQAPQGTKPPYLLYGETRAPVRVSADDEEEYLGLSGEVYYYTQVEFDETVDAICNALGKAGASWAVEAIGYNPELAQIEYRISWEVPCGAGEIYK